MAINDSKLETDLPFAPLRPHFMTAPKFDLNVLHQAFANASVCLHTVSWRIAFSFD